MNWEGFLMGVSDFGLERLKEERQKKMQKELLELQQKYARETAEFQQKLKDKSDAKRVHETIETEDGKKQGVNVFNQPVGEARGLSPWEIEERERVSEKHDDSLKTSASTRNYQAGSLDIRRQELADRREAGIPDLEPPEVGISDIMEYIMEPYGDIPLELRAPFRERARKVATDVRNMPAEAGASKLETASMKFDMEVTPLLGDASGGGGGGGVQGIK